VHTSGRLFASAVVAGLGALAYARWESERFTLRRATVRALPTRQPDLRVLHLSDLHLVPGQPRKKAWVSSLRELNPDAVIATGDFLSHEDAIPEVIETLEPLFDIPGAFVLGSNDYYAPKPINPARYLQGPSGLQPNRPMLPWQDLVAGLTAGGWLDLTNTKSRLKADGREIDIRGVDDPHIGRDNYDDVAGAFDRGADLALAVRTRLIFAYWTRWQTTVRT
jgi:predicted MPP superfamily phosphohydrolase